MTEFADRLSSEGHYEAVEIRKRRAAVLERRSKVKKSAVKRRLKLEDCRRLTVFLQDCAEVNLFYKYIALLACTSFEATM